MGVTELGLSMTIAFAIWTDWRQQKIYNALLVPAFLVAVGLQTYQKGWLGLQSRR